MNTLIIKLGASGDVVRTSSLLRCLTSQVTWLTEAKNTVLLHNLNISNIENKQFLCYSWQQRELLRDRCYDLVINLEDTLDVANFLNQVKFKQLFGAYLGTNGSLNYTDNSRKWFDLSLISHFGKNEADRLKFQNRRSYQELIFEGLGFRFVGQKYVLPKSALTGLMGDVALAAEAGPMWPMKNWDHYSELKSKLEEEGLTVNFLPLRNSLIEHLSDIQNHRCLIGGDSLPMHLALGTETQCITLFNCTSPWEIHDYGIQTKIISPLLGEFFYKRTFDDRATTAILLEDVFNATLQHFHNIPLNHQLNQPYQWH